MLIVHLQGVMIEAHKVIGVPMPTEVDMMLIQLTRMIEALSMDMSKVQKTIKAQRQLLFFLKVVMGTNKRLSGKFLIS
jgi:hypothetical protein